MSRRITRSAARLAASESASLPPNPSDDSTPLLSPSTTTQSDTRRQHEPSRKRKADRVATPPTDDLTVKRRTKRIKAGEAEQPASTKQSRPRRQVKSTASPNKPRKSVMSGQDSSAQSRRTSASRRRQPSPPGTSSETSPQHLVPQHQSRRKASRQSSGHTASKSSEPVTSSRRSKKGSKKDRLSSEEQLSPPAKQQDEPLKADDKEDHDDEDLSDEDDLSHSGEPMDEDDPFTSQLLSRMGGSSSIGNTLRALGGMMSGTTGRLRMILGQLKSEDDPSVQMIALTDLSELLLISNEDNLVGHFAPDQFVKELVTLMQPNQFGEENPEMMLLACRCIANLMEAIPSATASVVYGGAVPILCQKLLEIHYIDLAEQALSTLEKISVEFPASIVREGGLTACLTYLDFFATSTQRTAVTTAANCCRGIPEECFPVIKDVMPILLGVLSSNDQKVVEQGSLCVCRIIESFKWQENRLEELVNADLLKAILRLLLPGTTNLIGANIHTQFLRVMAIAARASPHISIELLRLQVVDTLYQILAGVSPPAGSDHIASQIDKSIIMQALIRSPKDQIHETLNVICELLPAVPKESLTFIDDLKEAGLTGLAVSPSTPLTRSSPNEKRIKLLAECPSETRRFAAVLLPTLMHAYTSTVNTTVRQKVLTAQLKILFNFEVSIVADALESMPFASHIASLLTQQDDPVLITCALQIAEILINRLGDVYKHQFYREGVVSEITGLSQRQLASEVLSATKVDLPAAASKGHDEDVSIHDTDHDKPVTGDLDEDVAQDAHIHPDDEEDDEDQDDEDDDDGASTSESSTDQHAQRGSSSLLNPKDLITLRARKFVASIGAVSNEKSAIEASDSVQELRELGERLLAAYGTKDYKTGKSLFQDLAKHFSNNTLDGITSYELLKSDIVDALLKVFADKTSTAYNEASLAFLDCFMTLSDRPAMGVDHERTPFGVLLYKLQDLLSRTEHFEVITVHQHSYESSRHSPTSMLAKQLRLKLTADEKSGIPLPYRNIMVSIHAIATFKALDDYLRPRIALAEKPDYLRAQKALFGNLLSKVNESAGRDTPTADSKTSKPRQHGESQDPTPQGSPPASLRRSSRHAPTKTPSSTKLNDEKAPVESPFECEDETKLSSEDEEMGSTIDALMGEVDPEAEPEEDEEPPPVNMEVAGSGKVTAHKEDGTRIATPRQDSKASIGSALSPSASQALNRTLFSTPAASARPMSYASAVQAPPQDWHIEFQVNGQPISNDTTIYRAVHFTQGDSQEVNSRAMWAGIHKISFCRVPGPAQVESQSFASTPDASSEADGTLPPSLSKHPQTASILQFMSILHRMSNNLATFEGAIEAQGHQAEPLSNFINTKLTAKLNRQLEEPLIVASNCLPSWVEDLARLYPFLFPFESRHLFLQSTSFGYSRSMSRWQSGQAEASSRRHRDERPFLGRNQRQKVRISRSRILESALKVMEMYGSSPSILEVEYFEEVGTGLGPTLEFYSTISKEFSRKRLKLWRENESEGTGDYAFARNGLFPAPMSAAQADGENGKRVLQLFRLLGKFVARSMLDSRLIDVSFNPEFFQVGERDGLESSIAAVGNVDKALGQSLKGLASIIAAKNKIQQDESLSAEEKQHAIGQLRLKNAKVEDLGIDFTLPGYPSIELVPGSGDVDLTLDNIELYVDSTVDLTLRSGVIRQVEAFRTGFSQVFPYAAVRAFTPDELVMLFGRTNEDWSLETLMDSIKADHGFNLDSQTIRNLLQTMSEYDENERRQFLQFVTGSPKLPIGGFKSLTPMFTVVCKPSEPPLTPDDYLPSVMTCVNYLKMPDYTSADVLRAKLSVAIKEGQGAFHLS